MSEVNDVEELQIKVAFLEDAIIKLSDEYATQQRELEILRGAMQSLHQRLQAADTDSDHSAVGASEKPPHY